MGASSGVFSVLPLGMTQQGAPVDAHPEIEFDLGTETVSRLREGAFQLFEHGKYDDVLSTIEGLQALRVFAPELLLLQAVCLNELGNPEASTALFSDVEKGLGQMAAGEGEHFASQIASTLDACRSWLPGGKRSSNTRQELADSAHRWIPRSKGGRP